MTQCWAGRRWARQGCGKGRVKSQKGLINVFIVKFSKSNPHVHIYMQHEVAADCKTLSLPLCSPASPAVDILLPLSRLFSLLPHPLKIQLNPLNHYHRFWGGCWNTSVVLTCWVPYEKVHLICGTIWCLHLHWSSPAFCCIAQVYEAYDEEKLHPWMETFDVDEFSLDFWTCQLPLQHSFSNKNFKLITTIQITPTFIF